MPDANVNIKFNSEFNGKGAKEAEQAVKGVSENTGKAAKGVKEIGTGFTGLGTQTKGFAAEMKNVDSIIGKLPGMIAGMAIPAFVINSVKSYIDTVGSTTQIGNDWNVATDKLQSSYMRLGETLAKDILPILEKIAKAAKETEFSSPVNAVGDLATLAMIGTGQLADTVGSAVMGTPNENYWAKQQFYKAQGLDKNGKSSEYGVPGGQIGPPAPTGNMPGAGKVDEISNDKVLQYYQLYRAQVEQDIKFQRQKSVMQRNFNLQESYAIADYQKSRLRGERDFNRQLLYANEDYQKSQYRATRDFQRQEAITVEAFNRSRVIANRDFQISLARNEYDFQKQRARSQYDHNWSIRMAMLEGDAMSVWQANRQFKIDKQRAEEDYQLSKSRAQEDFQRSQNDEMVAFQIERQNALIQYEIQRADALQDFNINRKRQLIQYDIMRRDQEIDFEIQRQRAANQLSIQQRDMQYEYEQEIRIRDQMFVDSQLPHIIWQEQTKAKIMAEIGNSIVAHYEGLLARVNSGNYGTTNTYNSAGGFAYLPSKAVGGYVKQTGAEFLHSGEFVLTKSTVDAAEGLAKSNQLSQNQLLDMMAGGDNTTFIFNRGVPPDERYQIRNEFAQMVEGAFRK